MSGTQLIPDASRMPAFRVDPFKLTIVGLDTNDGPTHDLYDQRIHDPIADTFVESIIAYGIVQTVRVAVRDGVTYVVAGRQRVRGARRAIEILRERGEVAEITVPCIGERMRDGMHLSQIAIVENEHRRDDGPMAKAAKAQTLLDRGLDIKRIAVVFGVETNTIRAWLRLSGVAPQVKRAVESGAVSATAAAKWADLPSADQVAALELAIAESPGKRVSVKSATRTVDPGAVVRPSKRALLKLIDGDTSDFARGVRVALGMEPMPIDVHVEIDEAAQ